MTDSPQPGAYRVLARKYRPRGFDELIGQEALVRTLSNAISSGRIAHAFVLTGVRGVGKTTTARIIARALNCVGPDGTGGPTIAPCGVCNNCTSIAEDRHVDVIEMDAASRTGIDDIRDLIEGVRYKPVSARYKVYIIDEVHMLSRQAFNGLLKTLEEPPEHVIFVFATTEIRKVPVTVLSRCQRFDLRRVERELLAPHFRAIAEKEGVKIEDAAVDIIARAADGSVRDGLSLLDQGIALSADMVTAAQIRDMLGLADRSAVFDLFDSLMSGNIAAALDQFQEMYRNGADPIVILEDLLELTHWLTRVKIAPALAEEPGVPEEERSKGAQMSGALTMPVLTRCWQMLLKGLGETQIAPSPLSAAEMVLIRLTHATDMPPPSELLKTLKDGSATVAAPSGPTSQPVPAATMAALPQREPASRPAVPQMTVAASSSESGSGRAVAAREAQPAQDPDEPPMPDIDSYDDIGPSPDFDPDDMPVEIPGILNPQSYEEVVGLFDEKREGILTAHLRQDVHLVHFSPGRIEFRPGPHAPKDLANRMGHFLSDWTGERWIVSISDAEGAPTLSEQRDAAEAARFAEANSNPLVNAVKEAFPGARVIKVVDRPGRRPAETMEKKQL
ncbi:MAG: DNA polymerase III subunit gamma/tau [Proteobacteria bacterium]|nr:DNA polymerase III subunit gamma/tau [Pseudomonadota bacterium]